ncbi:MAG: tetraacyldisaccharide 4'-kinase [Myxococcales bacterium]|nr:tetraacyldisaccharide 4'-kinase [Myxococcales bacterium]
MLYTRWSRLQSNLAIILTPLSWLYAFYSWLRNEFYDRGWLTQYRGSPFIISVGGIEAGGSGKTPVSAYILQELLAEDKNVGLVSRGYGRKSQGLVIRQKGQEVIPTQHGDEPTLLLSRYADVPAAICGKRALGVEALSQNGVKIIVCDDAFSHRALHRDLDVVVLRGEAPLADENLLPRGHLRESPQSLQRADLVWLHHKSSTHSEQQSDRLAKLLSNKTVVESNSSLSIQTPEGAAIQPQGQEVIALAGIAHPQSFNDMLVTINLQIVDFISFPDHCAYDSKDLQKIGQCLEKNPSAKLLMTAKDYVKLAPHWPADRIWIANLELSIVRGEEHLKNALGSAP